MHEYLNFAVELTCICSRLYLKLALFWYQKLQFQKGQKCDGVWFKYEYMVVSKKSLCYKIDKNEAVITLSPEDEVICIGIISTRGDHCHQFLWQIEAACISFQ